MPAERDNTIPLYYQIAETLKGRIGSQGYRPGDLLPPEHRIAGEFGVSSITVRKAMALLVGDKIVVRRRGAGTRILRRPEERLPIKITGNFRDWFDSASGRLQGLDVEVLEIGLASCPETIQALLGLPRSAPVWRMRRIRRYREEPISYYVNYGPPTLHRVMKAGDFRRRSFIEVLQRRMGIRLSRMEQRVEATVADMDVSAILGVEFGAPLFFVENQYFAGEAPPVEVTHMYYRGDRYVYQTTIRLEEGGDSRRREGAAR